MTGRTILAGLLFGAALAACAALCGGCTSLATNVRQVESNDPNVRRQGVESIARNPGAKRYPKVRELLCLVARSDPDPQVRGAACRALGRNEGEGVIDTLTHVLENDREPYVRVDAVAGLAMHRGPEAIPPIAKALAQDPSLDVQVAAAQALRKYKERSAADALVGGVGASNIAVAQNSWESLRYMTGQNLPRDPDPWKQYLKSTQKPFARYGRPPPLPKGEDQRPFVVRGPADAVKDLFKEDVREGELK